MRTIAVEGLDAAGKHTATMVLEEYFKSEGLVVRRCAFPDYGSPTGELIRQWLRGEYEADYRTFELLQAADKQANQAVIAECEAEGVDVLIIDRYVHSQWAYGAYRNDLDWLQSLTSDCRMPDAVLYLDVEPEVSMHRKGKYGDNDRYEDDLDHLRHARETYLQLLGHGGICPGMHVQTVDANQPQLIVKGSLFHAAKRLAWSLNLTGERYAAAVN